MIWVTFFYDYSNRKKAMFTNHSFLPSLIIKANWVLSLKSSLSNIFVIWFLTVHSAIYKAFPISLLVLPSLTNKAISYSLLVKSLNISIFGLLSLFIAPTILLATSG